MTYNGEIDGIRVDRVLGGYAAGHPEFRGVVVDACPWYAAWLVARCVLAAWRVTQWTMRDQQ